MVVGLSWETLQPSETEWEQEADLGYTALVAHPPGCIFSSQTPPPRGSTTSQSIATSGGPNIQEHPLQGVFYAPTLTEYRFNKVCAEGVYII